MNILQGKTIFITGAARGIGAAAARVCHEAGAKVILHASASSPSSAQTAEAVGQTSDDFLYEDLSKSGAGFKLMARALQRAGKIDGIVNNAGIDVVSPLSGACQAWDESWANTLAVNLQAPADICRAAIAHFRENETRADDIRGAIVNITSRAAHRGDGVEHAAYAASKGALLAMTKTWARGLANENILFFAIAPGWVDTRMAPQEAARRDEAVKEVPLGRLADPDEVGAMVAFLLSGACPSATGATFDINGASYIR